MRVMVEYYLRERMSELRDRYGMEDNDSEQSKEDHGEKVTTKIRGLTRRLTAAVL